MDRLAIDLGEHSIGWALIDSSGSVVNSQTRVLTPRTHLRTYRRALNRKIHTLKRLNQFKPIIAYKPWFSTYTVILNIMVAATIITATLAFWLDWQFWLNITIAFFIATTSFLKK